MLEHPMPTPEAVSDQHINKLIDIKQKDLVALLQDLKKGQESLQKGQEKLQSDLSQGQVRCREIVDASRCRVSFYEDVSLFFPYPFPPSVPSRQYNAGRRRRNKVDQASKSKIIPLKSFDTGELLSVGSARHTLPKTHGDADGLSPDRVRHLAGELRVDIEGLDGEAAKYAVLRCIGGVHAL